MKEKTPEHISTCGIRIILADGKQDRVYVPPTYPVTKRSGSERPYVCTFDPLQLTIYSDDARTAQHALAQEITSQLRKRPAQVVGRLCNQRNVERAPFSAESVADCLRAWSMMQPVE